MAKIVKCTHCEHSQTIYEIAEQYYCNWCGRYFQQMFFPENVELRSQKLKGLKALQGMSTKWGKYITSSFTGGMRPLSVLGIVSSLEEVEKVWGSVTKTDKTALFARPCPVVPRHGFVESRKVSTLEEFTQVCKETFEAEEKGQVMLVPLIEAQYNMVLTPTMLTVGAGHDGATAGKNCLNFPLLKGELVFERNEYSEGPFVPSTSILLKDAGVPEDCDPYVEAVVTKDGLTLTQLRSGPKTGKIKSDFIPYEVIIEKVLTPNGMDLLEWEKLILSEKDTSGVVVNNFGGSPIDHYSVHARTFGMPVVTTRVVNVGETLEPIPCIPMSVESVLRGMAFAEKFSLSKAYRAEWERAVLLSLVALHNSGAFEGEDGFWLGFGAGLLMRFGFAALKGEARHINEKKPGRETVYVRILDHPFPQMRAGVPRTNHILRYGQFSSSAIGGEKWALCGAALLKMFNGLGKLAKEQTQESLGEFIRVYNETVNQAHNGGWWLNKFTDSRSFDRAVWGDGILALQMAPILYDLHKERDAIAAKVDLDKSIQKWASWRELKPLPKVTLEKASLNFLPSGDLSLTVMDKLLRDKRKSIYLEEVQVDKVIKAVNKSLFLTQGENGVEVNIYSPKGDVEKVYNDPPLQGSALKK